MMSDTYLNNEKTKAQHDAHLQETSVRADSFPARRVCAQVVSGWGELLS